MKVNESITSSAYSIDGLQQNSWFYVWGPQGLEYSNKNKQGLTQNFSTDANANPEASFQYDLHTGRLISSWNPSNLEVINLEDGIVGGINITVSTAIGKDIILPPRQPPNIGGSTNGDNWGTAQIYVGGNASRVQLDAAHPNFGKDCGDDGMRTMGGKSPWRKFVGENNPCKGKAWEYGFISSYLEIKMDEKSEEHYWYLNEAGLKRLRNAGFNNEVVHDAARKIGECLARYGFAECRPIKCPNGTCGLRCACHPSRGADRVWSKPSCSQAPPR